MTLHTLIPLLQAATTPEGIPPWLWIALAAFGTWATTQFWPSVRAWIDADFKARRAEGRQNAEQLTQRLLAAQETTAAALASIAESNRATADALNIFASHRAADSLALDELRRMMRRLLGEQSEGRIVRRLPTPAAAAEAEE